MITYNSVVDSDAKNILTTVLRRVAESITLDCDIWNSYIFIMTHLVEVVFNALYLKILDLGYRLMYQ